MPTWGPKESLDPLGHGQGHMGPMGRTQARAQGAAAGPDIIWEKLAKVCKSCQNKGYTFEWV